MTKEEFENMTPEQYEDCLERNWYRLRDKILKEQGEDIGEFHRKDNIEE